MAGRLLHVSKHREEYELQPIVHGQLIILIHKDVEAHIQESSTSNTKLPMSS